MALFSRFSAPISRSVDPVISNCLGLSVTFPAAGCFWVLAVTKPRSG